MISRGTPLPLSLSRSAVPLQSGTSIYCRRGRTDQRGLLSLSSAFPFIPSSPCARRAQVISGVCFSRCLASAAVCIHHAGHFQSPLPASSDQSPLTARFDSEAGPVNHGFCFFSAEAGTVLRTPSSYSSRFNLDPFIGASSFHFSSNSNSNVEANLFSSSPRSDSSTPTG